MRVIISRRLHPAVPGHRRRLGGCRRRRVTCTTWRRQPRATGSAVSAMSRSRPVCCVGASCFMGTSRRFRRTDTPTRCGMARIVVVYLTTLVHDNRAQPGGDDCGIVKVIVKACSSSSSKTCNAPRARGPLLYTCMPHIDYVTTHS